MKDWTLVVNALPPQEEWVIIYNPDDKPRIWLGQWRRNTVSSKAEWNDVEGCGIESPTHWCPMPDFPLERGNVMNFAQDEQLGLISKSRRDNDIIKDHWPIVLTPKNIPVSPTKLYDADGVECTYAFEVNRITGECKKYTLNEFNIPFAISEDELAVETVMLKTPISITHAVTNGMKS